MDTFPTDEKKIRSRISSYKSALKKEYSKFGCYSDGSGKRYSLFVLHFALGDLKKLEAYMNWYHDNFPDDVGEPAQQLCCAIGLNRMGHSAKAEFRLAEQMLSNLYIIPQILGRSIKEYDMWHSSNWQYIDYINYVPDELLATFTEQDLAWIEEKYDSLEFKDIRGRHVELYSELEKTSEAEARKKILNEARKLLRKLEKKCS